MADNFGAKPYDYADYYTPIRGRNEADKLKGNEVAPGQDMVSKLRSLFSMFGVDQTPVNLNNPNASIGEKLRGGLGLAPALQPTATQADVRKSDLAMAGPGAVAPPVAPAVAAPASSAVTTPALTSAPPAREPAYAGMTAADIHGTAIPPRGTGAILNESTGKVTNIGSRTPDGPGAAPQGFQARPGSLASFFGAAMRQKQAGAQDAAARATALKLPEIAKTQAETTILSERAKLAAAEPDPAKKAAILSGTSLPKDETTFPTGLQPLEGGYGVGAKGGKLTRVPITQAATTADFAADVKRLGSKEAVLAEYARRNITPPDASKGAAAKPAFDFNAEPPPGMQIARDYVGRPLPYYEPFGTMH